MELIAQLPMLLAVLMLAAVVALSSEQFAANRKVRDDARRYRERVQRDHGEDRRERQDPPER
jgi:hypothetical protein